jgi:phage tail-like protein
MARSAANDPLEKFRFLVDVALPDTTATNGATTNAVRLGFHDIQMPKRTTNKVSYREGHNPDISSLSAGLSTMEDVVMSRGVIAGDGTAANDFYKWIKAVYTPSQGITSYTAAGVGAATDNGVGNNADVDYRGQITINLLDRSGTIVRCWVLYNAWPTHFVPASDLNAGEDGEKSMEALTLAYEDFQEVQVVGGAVNFSTPL